MISAKFSADFSSFLNAVQQADIKLADFGKGATSVENKLNKMVDGFSGRAVIQEAVLMGQAITKIGGNAQLSTADLEKFAKKSSEAADYMKRLGIEGAAGMQAIADGAKASLPAIADVGTQTAKTTNVLADLEKQVLAVFSVTSLVNFGKEVLDAGDKIQKMADQTGLSTDEVQKLDYIAGQSGTSIESLIGAVQNLQVRLGDENSGAAGAFAKLGISADAFAKLGTYQQMTTLGEAIKNIKDPTEQASVSAAVFGKAWKEVLPAIKSGMEEVGNQAPIMADNVVKATDRIGDALKAGKQQAIVWGAGMITALDGAGFAVGDFLSRFDPEHFSVATSEILKLQKDLNDPDGLTGALGAVKAPTLAVGASIKTMGASAKETAVAQEDLTQKAKDSIEQHKQLAAELKKVADAQEKFRDSVKSFSFGTFIADTSKLNAIIPDLSGHISDMVSVFAEARDQMHDLESSDISFNSAVLETDAGVRKLFTAFSTLPNVVAQFTDQIEKSQEAADSLSTTIGKDLTDALSKIPDLMIHAFTGGGGLSGAFKAIGTSLAKAIVDPLAAGLSKAQKQAVGFGSALSGGIGAAAGLGSTASAAIAVGTGIAGAALALASSFGVALAGTVGGTIALGAATAGIGAAAVGIVLLVKHFTGLSATIKQARADVEKFESAMGGVQGTIDTVGKAFAQLGLSGDQAQAALKALWNTNAGAAAVEKAVSDITDKLQRASFVSQILDGDFHDALAAGVAMGATLPPALQASIQKLVDMGVVTGDNAKLFAQMTGDTTVSFSTMRDIAQKYGADLNNLGPKFEAAKVGDTAKSIINDFDTLQRGLDDTDEALTVLRKPINDLVNDSLKFGVAIPENMKPWVEQLENTGQLIDENGDAITDISKIKFSAPIETQFQALIDKISKLIDTISGPNGLNASINNIPSKKDVEIVTTHTDVYNEQRNGGDPAFAANGGIVTTGGVQYLGAGGRVRQFGAGGFVPMANEERIS